MSLQQLDLDFDACAYNRLPKVEDAYAELKKCIDLEKLLRASADVLSRVPHLDVGLFLLHKHHKLQSGEIMLEQYEVYEEDPALIYSPAKAESRRAAGVVPCRWRIIEKDGDSVVVPLEYSTDQMAIESYSSITGCAEALGSLIKVILESHADGILGLASVKRSLPLATSQIYLETSDNANRRSIIRTADASAAQSAIPTIWSLDASLRCKTETSCTSRWECSSWCRSSGSGHDREHQRGTTHDALSRHVYDPD
jgi:hypothetical protein